MPKTERDEKKKLKMEDTIKRELPCLSNVVLIGDKQKFVTAFLTFKVTAFSIFCKSHLPFSRRDSILRPVNSNPLHWQR
jgi:hypothetical protein